MLSAPSRPNSSTVITPIVSLHFLCFLSLLGLPFPQSPQPFLSLLGLPFSLWSNDLVLSLLGLCTASVPSSVSVSLCMFPPLIRPQET
ncbi:hypothetical protein BXZ70DRAFT_944872 [Cristinia sonorae]|uniref:Uncharacterized protein n=1 Tax=Cristinia sonorae TaxID=1940300 RepID=A0A8K0UKM3_9AGAR|nr:hypothetical protein BXZ70DRAFT_944872 [Cristinia sonorae]